MKILLTLIVTPVLEQSLTDWLLVHPQIEGFTSHTAFGHGGHHALTIAEQVSGRRKQIVFWLEMEQALAEEVLVQLKLDFAGSELHYWQIPLNAHGVLN
ncbi:DUF3240 family protein [Methylophaga sp. OBS4]|uniref:DUF3240 family protein n=1 Tax=Methylophaga sp. OBS4 TaxID=2991935 RepID=UPI00225857B1|nr:DUF3240 family protein [Methylophaga sp. OBS4]MCX4186854.1 DUF3240 family protein [Methylophaga sp. OBS4]